MQIVVDDLLTEYERYGKGPVVLLLHGWGDNHRTFNNIIKTLSAGFECVVLDLPGFGSSQAPNSVWNLDNYAIFVNHFLKKLHLDQPYAIIGHSNGGALAIRGLAEGHLKSSKLILLAASGIREGKTIKRLFWKLIAKTGKVLTFWLSPAAKRRLRIKLYGVAGSDMLVAPALQETFKRTVRQDVQDDASRLQLPTLLIYAEGDQAVPVADGRKYASLIKESRLMVVPGANHYVHHTAAEKVNQAIKEFI